MTEYSNEFLNKSNKVELIEQKRSQVINESMQMKSVSKVQFGQLNDKRFYFSNGIPYGHLYLENWENKSIDIGTFIKLSKEKKDDFLKEQSKVIQKIPRLKFFNKFLVKYHYYMN